MPACNNQTGRTIQKLLCCDLKSLYRKGSSLSESENHHTSVADDKRLSTRRHLAYRYEMTLDCLQEDILHMRGQTNILHKRWQTNILHMRWQANILHMRWQSIVYKQASCKQNKSFLSIAHLFSSKALFRCMLLHSGNHFHKLCLFHIV